MNLIQSFGPTLPLVLMVLGVLVCLRHLGPGCLALGLLINFGLPARMQTMKSLSNLLHHTPWWLLVTGGFVLLAALALFATPFALINLQEQRRDARGEPRHQARGRPHLFRGRDRTSRAASCRRCATTPRTRRAARSSTARSRKSTRRARACTKRAAKCIRAKREAAAERDRCRAAKRRAPSPMRNAKPRAPSRKRACPTRK